MARKTRTERDAEDAALTLALTVLEDEERVEALRDRLRRERDLYLENIGAKLYPFAPRKSKQAASNSR